MDPINIAALTLATLSEQKKTQPTDCLILPVFEDHGKQVTAATQGFHRFTENTFFNLHTTGDVSGTFGEMRWVYPAALFKIGRVLFVGMGPSTKLTPERYRELCERALIGLESLDIPQAYCYLPEVSVTGRDLSWKLSQAVLAFHTAFYHFDDYREKPKSPFKKPKSLTFCYHPTERASHTDDHARILQIHNTMGAALHKTKDLANTPPNICTPRYLAEQAKALANPQQHLSCEIYGEAEMKALGMGALLCVSVGSAQEPQLIVLKYQGADPSAKPYVLVGKGVTFDTGGYSLKPRDAMLGMKYDMSGAASVLATLQAVAALKLSINVIGVMPCTENMIGHQATRPNDIVKSLKGKTIEITNTDAEGRLILSDALWFSKQYNPQVVIDIATLTGAIVVALGHHYTGLFCNDPALQAALTQAADSIQDPIWPLPLATSYEKDLKSPCADLQNATNKPPAGSIMGALFLQEFIPDCPWAHLDIAGTATVQGKYQHATGRPVPLLIQYLIDQATPSTQ